MKPVRTLNDFPIGTKARVLGFQETSNETFQAPLRRRLEELGFIQNTIVEIIHQAPFSKDPIAVTARGSTFALRRVEAAIIQVEEV